MVSILCLFITNYWRENVKEGKKTALFSDFLCLAIIKSADFTDESRNECEKEREVNWLLVWSLYCLKSSVIKSLSMDDTTPPSNLFANSYKKKLKSSSGWLTFQVTQSRCIAIFPTTKSSFISSKSIHYFFYSNRINSNKKLHTFRHFISRTSSFKLIH